MAAYHFVNRQLVDRQLVDSHRTKGVFCNIVCKITSQCNGKQDACRWNGYSQNDYKKIIDQIKDQMSLIIVTVGPTTVDKMTIQNYNTKWLYVKLLYTKWLDKMTLDKMTLDKMTLDIMIVFENDCIWKWLYLKMTVSKKIVDTIIKYEMAINKAIIDKVTQTKHKTKWLGKMKVYKPNLRQNDCQKQL